jgi:hypothetical protein
MKCLIAVVVMGFAIYARADNVAKSAAPAPKPETVSFLCDIRETSVAGADESVLRFVFDSQRFAVGGGPRKSLMSHDVWLADGSSVSIVEIDESGESSSTWIPKFLQQHPGTQSRHFMLSVSWGRTDEPTEIARVPVEELMPTASGETVIPLGRTGTKNLPWLLKCRQI